MKKTTKKDDKTPTSKSVTRKSPPARSQEARENQMIALAENLAEEQLRNGTASSQIIVHYLRLATTREQLEKSNLEEDIKLKKAKTEALESAKQMEKMYANAIAAMRSYSGLEEASKDIKEEESD